MTDFKAKMHQIRFRLGLCPSLQRSPTPPSWIGGAASRQGEGLGWGREGKGEGNGREGKWRGGKGRAPKLLLNHGPSEPCYATDTYVGMYKPLTLCMSREVFAQDVVNDAQLLHDCTQTSYRYVL